MHDDIMPWKPFLHCWPWWIDCLTHLPLDENGHHFAEDMFRCIFMNEKFSILIKISIKFVPKRPIDNNTALAKIMAWHQIGDKPLSVPVLTRFHWRIYVLLGENESNGLASCGCHIELVIFKVISRISLVKSPSGECHKRLLIVSQHCFR